MSELKARIVADVKAAMRAADKPRLTTLRMLQAAIKQREVDERIELDDAAVQALVTKQIKQRQDAESQYRSANRIDLADAEAAEIKLLTAYLPEQLGEAEVDALIEQAIQDCGATSARDMGKVMAALKPRIAGRADMAQVSRQVKSRLG